ncbi:hypothetical protein E4T43_00835 [Aureobasidium subglaciale]|nr:hypothetical protein E4T43_00835 [Aureobasidium subglaciale]
MASSKGTPMGRNFGILGLVVSLVAVVISLVCSTVYLQRDAEMLQKSNTILEKLNSTNCVSTVTVTELITKPTSLLSASDTDDNDWTRSMRQKS